MWLTKMEKTYAGYQVLIVAAGCSRRMKKFKPMLPLGEKRMIEQTISRFLEAGLDDIIVVVGYRRKELLPVLGKYGVKIVVNEQYDTTDMLESVKIGVAQIKEDTKGLLICPADIPLIRPLTIRTVVEVHRKTNAAVVIPTYQQEEGHPPVIDKQVLSKFNRYNGDDGLRGILEKEKSNTRYVEVPDPLMLQDADTIVDYERLQKAYQSLEIPTEKVCQELWEYAKTPERVKAHCKVVANVAKYLGQKVNQVLEMLPEGDEAQLNLDRIQAAALLHDVMRQEKGHAKAGGKLLRDLGCSKVAEIIEAHKSLNHNTISGINECTLVYLADRMVIEDEISTCQERFARAKVKYADYPGALKCIEEDECRANRVKLQFVELIGKDLFE